MIRVTALLTLFFILVTSQPANAQLALSGGMYDHSIPQINYSPQSGFTWTTVSDALNFGGSRITSGAVTTTNPAISFDIFGDGFVLYIVTNSTGANANLCINSVCSGISYYSASTAYSTISVTGLGYGTHSILIQKTSTIASAINLDALYVYPPAPAPTVIPPTPIVLVTVVYPTPASTPVFNVGNWDEAQIQVEVTDDPSLSRFDVLDSNGDARSVSVLHQIDTGQVGTIIFQAGTLLMLIFITVLLARGSKT